MNVTRYWVWYVPVTVVGSVMADDLLSPRKMFFVLPTELVIDVGNVEAALVPESTHSAEGAVTCRLLPDVV